MATADYYEGQSVAECPACGRMLVRVRSLTPEGKIVWDVKHGTHRCVVPTSAPAISA